MLSFSNTIIPVADVYFSICKSSASSFAFICFIIIIILFFIMILFSSSSNSFCSRVMTGLWSNLTADKGKYTIKACTLEMMMSSSDFFFNLRYLITPMQISLRLIVKMVKDFQGDVGRNDQLCPCKNISTIQSAVGVKYLSQSNLWWSILWCLHCTESL